MNDDSTLARLRAEIDAIDKQLVELLNERAQVAQRVGIAKGGQNIIQPAREQQVLDNVTAANAGPLPDEALQEIFTKVIAACRQVQLDK